MIARVLATDNRSVGGPDLNLNFILKDNRHQMHKIALYLNLNSYFSF